jgi:hypothetical protein
MLHWLETLIADVRNLFLLIVEFDAPRYRLHHDLARVVLRHLVILTIGSGVAAR